MRCIFIIWMLINAGAFAQQPRLILPIGHSDKVNSAQYSPDGKKIVTASGDLTAKIWDASSGKLLADLRGHSGKVLLAKFSPANRLDPAGGKKIITISEDSTAIIWDANTGNLMFRIHKDSSSLYDAGFSPDGNKIITTYIEKTAKTWDAVSGKMLSFLKFGSGDSNYFRLHQDGKNQLSSYLKLKAESVENAGFSPDAEKIWTLENDTILKIWDANTGHILVNVNERSPDIMYLTYSSNSKKFLTLLRDNTYRIYDAASGRMLINTISHRGDPVIPLFSGDGKIVMTGSVDGLVKIWDASTGKLLSELKGLSDPVQSAVFSTGIGGEPKVVVTILKDGSCKIWNLLTGKLIREVDHNFGQSSTAEFSPDEKNIIISFEDNGTRIFNVNSNKLVTTLKGHADNIVYRVIGLVHDEGDDIHLFPFSLDAKKIITISDDCYCKIWDAFSGKLITNLKGKRDTVLFAEFSPDGKKIWTQTANKSIKIWDAVSGQQITTLKDSLLSDYYPYVKFTKGSDKIITILYNKTARVWDASNGNLLSTVTAGNPLTDSVIHYNSMQQVAGGSEFSRISYDGKRIVTVSFDEHNIQTRDAKTGDLLYTFFAVDSTDYLVIDKNNHYDGTAGARNFLYYTCNSEIVELQQLKDRLWVPGLADRHNKGETINSDKLSDLNICGLTPLIEPIKNKTGYQFKIIPQSGGLGETILYVNGIETKKYLPSELKKIGNSYELLVTKEQLKRFFIAGKENTVRAKAYTKDNDISSRGADVEEDDVQTESTPPDLYAVIIGVSDYKGEGLDLKYAAKDASDISNAVSLSATRLLGKEHVFMFNLNTGETHDKLPEKKSIKEVFAKIAVTAKANDILMVFFAGHGVVQGAKKQFYFLSADASTSSLSPAGVKDVGISTEELMDWMKPASIKAQKRILILDACNSGSAINQIVSIGKDQGYTAARNDDKAEEIKQIEKLNEKAGLYILAASASNQSAYELGRFSQGLLTYSLLKAIKEHPEVLEQNKFLNVSSWFNAAVQIVNDVVRESNLRQEPQLVTMSNFNIGIVDNEVLAKIILPDEKPLFASSNFHNTEDYDELDLGKAVNKQLNDVSSRGAEGSISYLTATDSPDAYIISGGYEVKGNDIILKINIRQSKDKAPKYRFEITGMKDDVKSLAEGIVEKAMTSIK